MISQGKKKEILSDKIANIISTTPGYFDPEDDIYEETTAKVSNNELEEDNEDVELSQFRKQNVGLLEDVDQKYSGKKGSRKNIYESEDESDGSHDEVGSEKSASEDEESEEDMSESDGGGSGSDIDDEEVDDNFKHMSDANTSGQISKGNGVRNQLKIWESLLEMRIQLQKCVIASNKFPQYDTFADFNSEPEFKEELANTKKSVTNMLDKFITLQELLLKQYPETKNLIKDNKTKSHDSDEEIPSDTEDEKEPEVDEEVPKKRTKYSDLESTAKTNFDNYKNYRNSVIQKWNDKTRLAVGKNNAVVNSVLQQITYILADKPRLLKRTQLKRTEYDIVGKNPSVTNAEQGEENIIKKDDDYDCEIYDDTDFYHQLLRELIEHKSADVTDPIQMSRNWIALQKYRSKIKRTIDTKATKGRKIRYDVHTKLVNFMAPIDECSWTDEAKNELYSSLFGNN